MKALMFAVVLLMTAGIAAAQNMYYADVTISID